MQSKRKHEIDDESQKKARVGDDEDIDKLLKSLEYEYQEEQKIEMNVHQNEDTTKTTTRSADDRVKYEQDSLRWEEDQISGRLQKKLAKLKQRIPTTKSDFVVKKKIKKQKVLKPFEDSD
jgi:hypothetical protein